MNSKDWEKFFMNVSKRVHGEHDGRNSYKYNNKDKEWIDYVKKYSNDKNNEKQENNKQSNDNDLDNGIITIFIYFGVIFYIIYTLTCYFMSI